MNSYQLQERANVLAQQGRYAEAIELGTKALQGLRKQLDDDDPRLALVLTNLGTYHAGLGQWKKALSYYDEGLAKKIQAHGEDHPSCAGTHYRIARCHEGLGDPEAAVVQYRRCIEILDEHSQESPAIHLRAIQELTSLLGREGRSDEARPLLSKGVRVAASQVKRRDARYLDSLQELMTACIAEREFSGLERALTEEWGAPAAAKYIGEVADSLVNRRRPSGADAPALSGSDPSWKRSFDAASRAVRAGDAQGACVKAQKAVDTAREKPGAQSLELAYSLNLLAVCYQDMDQDEDALGCFSEAVDVVRGNLGRNHPVYLTALYNISNGLARLERYAEAELQLQEVLELQRARKPVDASALALALYDLGHIRERAGKLSDALRMYRDAQEVLPSDDRLRDMLEVKLRATRMFLAGDHEQGQDSALRPEHRKQLEEVQRLTGQRPTPELLHRTEHLYAEAQTYIDETSSDHILILCALGRLNLDSEQRDQAIEFYERAMEIARAHHSGQGDPTVGFVADGLARSYMLAGRYADADSLYPQALAYLRGRFGEGDSRAINTMNAYGVNLLNLGRYTEAAATLEESLRHLRVAGKQDRDQIAAIGNLAVLYRHSGKYDQAEPLYEEAVGLAKECLGPESSDYALTLNNAALFHAELGRKERARELFSKALPIMESTLGLSHPEYARVLDNLALIYSNSGDDQEAEAMHRKACDVRRAALGEKHHDYLRSLHNLGSQQHKLGRPTEADSTLARALELKQTALGLDHPSCAITMTALAEVKSGLGESDAAEELFARSTEIRRQTLGDRHPSVARASGMEAQFYWKQGSVEKARSKFGDALGIYRSLVRELFPGMTESERAQYWDEIRRLFEVFTAFVLDANSEQPAVLGDLYDVQLFAKAHLVESAAGLRRAIAIDPDPVIRSTYESWVAKKRQLTDRVSRRGRAQSDSGEVDGIVKEIARLEKKLVARSRSFGLSIGSKEVTWSGVQRSLGKDEAAVEILRAPVAGFASSAGPSYAALVLRPDRRDHPRLVELGEAGFLEGEALERYIRFRDTVWGGAYEDFWKPLEAALAGARRVYLSPDGVYGRIDLNVLFDAERRAFLLDALDLRIVTTTRDLLEPEFDVGGRRTAVLFGRPAYDQPPTKRLREQTKAPKGNEEPRPNLPGMRTAEVSFSDLPGTEAEVQSIAALLRKNDWDVEVFLGGDACCAAISDIRSPRLLHVATHGFFFELSETHFRDLEGKTFALVSEEEPEHEPGFTALEQALERAGLKRERAPLVSHQATGRFSLESSPLFRSGLAMAGAGRESTTGEIGDDGLFTAYEATSLHVWGTELVVLSACESGRGELRAGEGAFGLERALRAAGARTILATLWPVDDTITQELMLEFYSRWTRGESPRDALRASQQKMRQKYRLPILWGGFTLVGR